MNVTSATLGSALALAALTVGGCTVDRGFAEMRTTPENVADTAASQALIAPLAAAYPGLSVTVFRGDEIVWSFEGGYADLEQKLPVTPRTKFNIYRSEERRVGKECRSRRSR